MKCFCTLKHHLVSILCLLSYFWKFHQMHIYVHILHKCKFFARFVKVMPWCCQWIQCILCLLSNNWEKSPTCTCTCTQLNFALCLDVIWCEIENWFFCHSNIYFSKSKMKAISLYELIYLLSVCSQICMQATVKNYHKNVRYLPL